MQFINIVVHSVDDMNYRVALQWEFGSLGLEEYLEKLRPNESEELSVQISGKNFPPLYHPVKVKRNVKQDLYWTGFVKTVLGLIS